MKYLERTNNFAARSNGYVLDGVGEFCPTGARETLEPSICVACHCQFNFHRKVEVELEDGVESPILLLIILATILVEITKINHTFFQHIYLSLVDLIFL